MKAIGICLLPLLLTGSGAVLADDEDIVERKKVRKVIVECEGDDCDRQVYVFKTGEAPMAWAGDDHDFRFYAGPRGFLGVQFLPLTDELAAHFGTDAAGAVMVSKVIDDSPAQRAGLGPPPHQPLKRSQVSTTSMPASTTR